MSEIFWEEKSQDWISKNKTFLTNPAGDDKNKCTNVTQIYLLIFKQNYNNIGLRWSLKKRKKERYTCVYLQLKNIVCWKFTWILNLFHKLIFISYNIHLKITFFSVKIIFFKAKTEKSYNNNNIICEVHHYKHV